MAYDPIGWENDVTDLSAENFGHMDEGIVKSYPVKLISVSEEAPSEFNTGDKYYNKTNNKIYTAISTSEFNDGEEPEFDRFYYVTEENGNYIYNGTTLVSVGGGGGSVTGDTLPIGSIIPFGGINVPAGWLICDGSEVSRTTYSDLFSKIGTSYGTGDGSTTFNLPNLKGKVLVGQDTDQTEFNEIGKTGGEKTNTLTIDEMPSHNHFGSPKGVNNMATTYQSGDNVYLAIGYNGYTNEVGGSQPHNNLQPYVTTNYIIKASQTAGLVASVVNTPSTSDKDTYSCDYINKISDYSTEEQVIGKWMDKPLYRKTVITNSPTSNNWHNIDYGFHNVKEVIRRDFYIYNSNGTRIPLNWYFSNEEYALAAINENDIAINVTNQFTGKKLVLILEYTKTTD